MTDSIGEQGASGSITRGGPSGPGRPLGKGGGEGREAEAAEGPDPAIGAGVTLLGIFVMGVGGAADAHYVFDAGMVVAVLGAMSFVLFVALSAMKQRQAEQQSGGSA